jgi:hypothetical protein
MAGPSTRVGKNTDKHYRKGVTVSRSYGKDGKGPLVEAKKRIAPIAPKKAAKPLESKAAPAGREGPSNQRRTKKLLPGQRSI